MHFQIVALDPRFMLSWALAWGEEPARESLHIRQFEPILQLTNGFRSASPTPINQSR
jgi:hypothetical protein